MDYDVLIAGGRVIDGTGNPWVYADVALRNDRIVRIAPCGLLDRNSAREVVAAAGMVVCPGFIDIQSHSIGPFMSDRRSLSKVTQGVTTEIMGELWTPAPFGGRRHSAFADIGATPEAEALGKGWTRFGDWLAYLETQGVAVNFGSFVGGATVREYAKGWDSGDPTTEELDIMRRVTTEAIEDGAFGIATALIYPPNAYSPDSELIEMARVVGEHGGLYITHIRSEGDELLESIDDTIHLARESKAPVEIYHLKATGPHNWPKIPQVIARINAARAEGIDIAADMYPYPASGTGLDTLVPYWVFEGDRFFANLRDPAVRARIRREMEAGELDALNQGRGRTPEMIMPVGFHKSENQRYKGKRLSEIALMRGQDSLEAALDLLVSEEQEIGTIFFSMSEDNVRLQLQQPWIKISSDAGGLDPANCGTPTHPRAYGTFTRVLGHYARDEAALSLEEAIRKMSSAVANSLGLWERGILRPQAYADVVIFDPETVSDSATFADPHQLSVGIRDV